MQKTDFQRARLPAQIQQRRTALLQAAAGLLADGGLESVSLSAIARTAGLAKSNVYRYFESREEILLELLLGDEMGWVADLERALAPLAGSGDTTAVAEAMTKTLVGRPTACQLISVAANILERNLSVANIVGFKTRVLEISIRAGNALHASLPGLPHERTPTVLRLVYALIAGLWPMGHPAARAHEALQAAEFEPLRSHYAADLQAGLEALLRGAMA